MPWEQTENFIRSGHRSPKEFEEGSLRTITLSEEEGIKAIIGKPKGRGVTEVQSYLFDVDKGWTLETAKAWFEEHERGGESFGWVGDVGVLTPYHRLIRGKAIHPLITVHPEEWPSVRVYLGEELAKSAETLISKPLFLDHYLPLKGEVLAATYEDGAIEYIAWLEEPKILEDIRSGRIRHCSVQFEWKSLENVNGVAPRGITFQHLSLLKNEKPGDPLSTVEIWEAIVRQLKEAKSPPADSNPKPDKNELEKMKEILEERVWDRRYVNDLPDSAFAIILLGGEKDGQGKTVPRTLRKFPHHRADGSIDLPHLRNANARVPQSDLSEEQKARAKAHLDRHKKALGIGEFAEGERKLFKHGWPVLKEQAEEPEEVEVVEFEVAPEPTMDELIESIEDVVESINNTLDALTSRVEALEKAQKLEEEEIQGQATEPPKTGVPKTDKERLVAHFGEETANKLLKLIGEEAYKLFPKRGIKVQQQGAEGTKETIESLRGQIEVLTEQKKALQEELKKAKKPVGEAIILDNVTPPPDMISREEVVKRLKEAVFERVPRHWGQGPYKQNETIKRLIRELESHS